MKRIKKIRSSHIVVVAATVITAMYIYGAISGFLASRPLDKVVGKELAAAKVSSRDMVGKFRHVYTERRYWVKDDFKFADFRRSLEKSLRKSGFDIRGEVRGIREVSVKGKKHAREEVSYIITERNSDIPVLRLTLIHKLAAQAEVPAVPVLPVVPPKEKLPKLAIVLDDWGYSARNLQGLMKIDEPVTLSILPSLPYSTEIAQKAREKGFEIIVHMPMEPKAKMRLETLTLLTTMSDDQIRVTFNKALASVPYAVGANNHEGSKATEDPRLMGVFLEELKKRDMFFLDSLVTNDSTGEYIAKKIGVRFAKRSIFLDNESNENYIRAQFEKAVSAAIKNGSAVAIGHDRPNTISVLGQLMPTLKTRGVEAVPVSELAE
jgi:hypothetical protein